ncbi:MAG: hypothetical protein K5871_09150 [Lachnospiraceae bacterium]|nr:hypothetical protein [Lachnospiraceae bacterium]
MSDNRTCPNCGAPVLSEICQYCGTVIENVSTAELASEYPTVECKLARISFFEAVFYASVAGIPGAIGIYVLTQALWIEDALFSIPFLLPLRKTSKPYPVNSKVKVRAYQEFATISKMKEEIKW